MKTFARTNIIVLLFVIFVLVSGCQTATPMPTPIPTATTETVPTPTIETPDTDTVKIAYLSPSLRLPFWRNVSLGIHESAAKADMTVIDLDSRQKANVQLQNVQEAINQNVKAIILSPVDSTSAVEVLESAEKAEIPVIICDIGAKSDRYVSFVITDNYKGSKDVGEYLAQVMQQKGWQADDSALITISLARQNGRDRTEGFKDAMITIGSPVVSILESQDYTQAESLLFVEELLANQPNLRALFSEHNEATLGAIQALEQEGKIPEILHVGFDGTPETLQAVKDGKLLALAVQQPIRMGREAFNATWDYLNGENPPKEISVPTLLVTQENINEIKKELEGNVYPKE
ncbi:substrate-binding domain-containing protein [Anaerolineales bacterium HSG25]|nr:substrate-binding domain-containing protein [Anaerolineales bacterium HSG25]